MCAGAIVNARIERVVYGAKDFRFGAFGSLVDIPSVGLNHFFQVEGGVLGEECAAVLSEYFKAKRKKTSNTEESALCETLMN
jgi:tRNA(adenine34) deaminase